MDLTDYVDVPTRMRLAQEQWPDMRIVEGKPELVEAGGHLFVSVTVSVWRSPDDPLPCTATAWEPFPGRSSFTKDSEMMNASTSAVGRALGLMGIGLKSSIATANEVRNRREDSRVVRTEAPEDQTRAMVRPSSSSSAPPASDKQKAFIKRLAAERGEEIAVDNLTAREAMAVIDDLKSREPIR